MKNTEYNVNREAYKFNYKMLENGLVAINERRAMQEFTAFVYGFELTADDIIKIVDEAVADFKLDQAVNRFIQKHKLK